MKKDSKRIIVKNKEENVEAILEWLFGEMKELLRTEIFKGLMGGKLTGKEWIVLNEAFGEFIRRLKQCVKLI